MNQPVDQADGLRRLLTGMQARMIAIVGMSRSVGASTVAMNLSVELARQGAPVLLLDEHHGSRSEARSACDMWAAQPGGTLADVAGARMSLTAAVATVPSGVRLLPAPTCPGSFNPRSLCRDGVIVVDAAFDSAGLSPLARLADDLLVVMQPSASSITAAYAALKYLHHTHALQRFKFLVNNVADAQQATLVMSNVVNASSRYLAVTLLPVGWISSDPQIAEAHRKKRAVCEMSPANPASIQFRAIAAALLKPAGVPAAGTVPAGSAKLLPRTGAAA